MAAVLLLLTLAADVEPDDPASMKVREATSTARLAAAEDAAKPLKITTEAELAKVTPDTALAGLKKQVDFKKEYLLVFTWAGSGGDRMTVTVEKGKKGPEAVFKRTLGRTNDLRRHQKLFVLPRKMTYSVGK